MKTKKIYKFRIELEHKVVATSFVEVEAIDSSDAWAKAMKFIKGKNKCR
jgi:hypothetical protein